MEGSSSACKESSVWQPGASGFCYRATVVNSVFSLPDRQVMFFEEFEWQKNCEINSANQEVFGLVEMTSGLVNASFSLSEWQAVKMIFFAPCELPSVKLQ